MDTENINALCEELNAWCDANGLPHESADALLYHPAMTDERCRWLLTYIVRWDDAMESA
jgi:hypothetical protein